MATEKETLQSIITKVTSLAPTATTSTILAKLLEGSKYATQANIHPDLTVSQKAAKQALLDKSKTLLDAETDLTQFAYLTKALDNYLIKDINGTGFSLSDLTSPMGGIHDEVNDVWYDLGHNIPVVQMQRRRVVCTGNPMWGGSVYRYLDKNNSALFEDGTNATAFIAGGSLTGNLSTYQVYVETPKHYYIQKKIGGLNYFAVGLTPFTITTLSGEVLTSQTDKAFRKSGWTAEADGTNATNEYDYHYTPAFEAVLFDTSASLTIAIGDLSTNGVTLDTAVDKLISVANLSLYLQPCTTITRANARLLHANATNKQWHWYSYSMTRRLYLCEYKNHNAQSTIGGYTEGGVFTYTKVAPTGTTLSLGNKTGAILNNGSVIPTIGGVSSSAIIGMSYRGEENIFGNVWKWCDGVNINNWVPYVCDINDAYTDNIFTGDYVQAGTAQPSLTGYQSTIQDGNFLVKSIGSSSAKDITDYYSQSSGQRVVSVGGVLDAGSIAGLSCLSFSSASGYVTANSGSR